VSCGFQVPHHGSPPQRGPSLLNRPARTPEATTFIGTGRCASVPKDNPETQDPDEETLSLPAAWWGIHPSHLTQGNIEVSLHDAP